MEIISQLLVYSCILNHYDRKMVEQLWTSDLFLMILLSVQYFFLHEGAALHFVFL